MKMRNEEIQRLNTAMIKHSRKGSGGPSSSEGHTFDAIGMSSKWM